MPGRLRERGRARRLGTKPLREYRRRIPTPHGERIARSPIREAEGNAKAASYRAHPPQIPPNSVSLPVVIDRRPWSCSLPGSKHQYRPDHLLPPPRLTHSFGTAGWPPPSVAMNRSAALPGAGRQRGAAAPVGEPDVPPVRIGKGPVERSPLPPVGKLAPLDGPVGIGRVPATPGRAYPGPKRKGRRNSTARVAAPWATRSSRPWPAPS